MPAMYRQEGQMLKTGLDQDFEEFAQLGANNAGSARLDGCGANDQGVGHLTMGEGRAGFQILDRFTRFWGI